MEIAGVRFEGTKKIYYFSANGMIDCSDKNVIVETDKGLQFGKCVLFKDDLADKKKYKKIVRIATKNDIEKHTKNLADGKKALNICKGKIDTLNLKMDVISASYTFDRKKLIFTFVSEERIDFRDLVKDLASEFHTRIELRQIGVRDEAKKVGGIGPCGRELCCKAFLNEFDSVSINMAKCQNLSLNPNKISGCCGRLMCCLNYENENYKKNKKELPKIGSKVKTESGFGRVISHNILKREYIVDIEGKEQVIISIDK